MLTWGTPQRGHTILWSLLDCLGVIMIPPADRFSAVVAPTHYGQRDGPFVCAAYVLSEKETGGRVATQSDSAGDDSQSRRAGIAVTRSPTVPTQIAFMSARLGDCRRCRSGKWRAVTASNYAPSKFAAKVVRRTEISNTYCRCVSGHVFLQAGVSIIIETCTVTGE